MNAPIIVDNHGDLLIFESLERASGYLEPVDVRNGEYMAYDSEGRLLDVKVETNRPRLAFNLRGPLEERVIFVPVESEPTHSDELRTKLINFLMLVGEDEEWLLQASFEQLVRRSLERHAT